MSDNEIEALLKRWADLEPDRCYQSSDLSWKPWHFLLGGYWASISLVEGPEPRDYSFLQGALQEAIEIRGWRLGIERNEFGYAAFVKSLPSFSRSRWIKSESMIMSKIPALPILSSYIKAIEINL